MLRDNKTASLRALPRRLLESASELVMPLRCVFCGVTSIDDERYVCSGCRDDLPWIRHGCPLCALELPAACAAGCALCQLRPPPFSAAAAPLGYSFPVDAAIKAFKFRRRLFFGPAFADILLTALRAMPADFDALLPVPLHRWRRLRRGFDQALELTKPLAAATGLPIIGNVARVIATPYQSGLTAAARRSNLKGAFRVYGRIRAQHILIVDDVITSGETCRQLAKVVLNAGAGKVSILAVARA